MLKKCDESGECCADSLACAASKNQKIQNGSGVHVDGTPCPKELRIYAKEKAQYLESVITECH